MWAGGHWNGPISYAVVVCLSWVARQSISILAVVMVVVVVCLSWAASQSTSVLGQLSWCGGGVFVMGH